MDTLPPEGELVVVFWIDPTGWPSEQDRYDFDMIEAGFWISHENLREEYLLIGGHSTGPGPGVNAPYTHWRRIGRPTPPAIDAQPQTNQE